MKNVVRFLQSFVPKKISTTMRCTCLKSSKDEFSAFFGTKQGHLGRLDLKSQEIILDEKLSESAYKCLALSEDGSFLIAGGDDPILKKYSTFDLKEIASYEGHTATVCELAMAPGDEFLISVGKDASVLIWPIKSSPCTSVTLCRYEGGTIWSVDLSKNGKYLAIGGVGGKAQVYQLDYTDGVKGELLHEYANDSDIYDIKLSPKLTFIVFGDANGGIKLLRLETWSLMRNFNHGATVNSLDFSDAENLIISGGSDKLIKVWDTKGKYEPIELAGHKMAVNSCSISGDQKSILSASSDGYLIIWRIPTYESETRWKCKTLEITKLWHSNTEKRLEGLGIGDNQVQAVYWDPVGNMHEIFKLTKAYPPNIIITEPDLVLFYNYNIDPNDDLTSEGLQPVQDDDDYMLIQIYSLSEYKKLRSHLIKANGKCAYLTTDMKYCFLGEPFRVSIWDYSNFNHIFNIVANKGDVLACITDADLKTLFSYGTDMTLKKFQLPDLTQESKEAIPKNSIIFNQKSYKKSCTLMVGDDNQFLYVVLPDEFKVIEMQSMDIIKSVDIGYLGILKTVKNILMLYTSCGIDMYSDMDFNLVCTYRRSLAIDDMILSDDHEMIYILNKNSFVSFRNPLVSKALKLIGPQEEEKQFISYINKLVKKTCTEPYTGKPWLIEPVHINIIHLYAYLGQSNLLYRSLTNVVSKRPFIESEDGWTPLSVAVFSNYSECVHTIIKSLRFQALLEKANGLTLQALEDNLDELNISGYPGMHKLYDSLLAEDINQQNPSLCDAGLSLPIVLLSEYAFPDCENFGISREPPETATAIEYYKSLCRFPMIMGSEISIEFLRSLSKSPNKAIFETELITTILDEKWAIARKFMVVQAILYLIYMVFIVLYNAFDESNFMLFVVLEINGLLYMYEIVFIVLQRVEYFKNFWNMVDTVRALSVFLYAFFVLFHMHENRRGFWSFIVLISWIRGITYFRVNSKTRYLINLLFQVIKDIGPFMIIFFYTTIGFGLSIGTLIKNGHEFMINIESSYMISMGGWENDNPNSDMYSYLLVLTTLINPIIVINLLVSILSDTYEQVQEAQAIADGLELNDMIIEIETLMFWNRKKNNRKYIHIVKEQLVLDENDEDAVGLAKNVKDKFEAIEMEITNQLTKLKRFEEVHNEKTELIIQGMMKLRGDQA